MNRRFGIVGAFAFLTAGIAQASDAAPAFRDVQLGVDGPVSRVVVECAGPCDAIRAQDGRFFLNGVSGALSIDLSQRPGFVSRLVMENLYSAAYLTVQTKGRPENISIANCGVERICVDVTAPQKNLRMASVTPPPSSSNQKVPSRQNDAKPVQEKPIVIAEATSKPVQLVPVKTAPVEVASLPPIPTQQPTSPQVRSSLLNEKGGWATQKEISLDSVGADDLRPEACAQYEAILQNDAWDLRAYKVLALCAAARGDLAKAEGMYQRLLKVYPEDKFAKRMSRLLASMEVQDGPRTAER